MHPQPQIKQQPGVRLCIMPVLFRHFVQALNVENSLCNRFAEMTFFLVGEVTHVAAFIRILGKHG